MQSIPVKNVKVVHVPYKGGADAISNLLAGEVAMVMTGVPPVIALARAGGCKIGPRPLTPA